MSDFEVETLESGLTRIILSAPAGLPEVLSEPTNVYFIDGSAPTLINAGHPHQSDALVRALRACGSTPAQIERIICTSWEVGVLGGATHFPRADLFVLSPDMQSPRDFELILNSRRQLLRKTAEVLASADKDFRLQPVEAALDRYYPRMTRNLRFIPLRNGHILRAGPLVLEVLDTAGPEAGHMALHDADQGLLFTGDFALTSLPRFLTDAQAYLAGLERLAALPSQRVLPNRGRTMTRGRWTVTRAARFFNNFMSSVPSALIKGPTILEFIERDRGYLFEDPLELIFYYLAYRTLFDELVRSRQIAATGEEPKRRYGVDIEDHRKEVRRF